MTTEIGTPGLGKFIFVFGKFARCTKLECKVHRVSFLLVLLRFLGFARYTGLDNQNHRKRYTGLGHEVHRVRHRYTGLDN